MPHDIKAYLWDMLEASKDIIEFTAGMKYPDFEQDKRTRYAEERQLLVIGEAANHLPENYLSKHQQIPWRQIIGMRNIIAHEYGEIISKRIWSVVSNNLPKLVHQLNDLLEE